MRKGDTIEIVTKGALRPGMRGAILKVNDDGSINAAFPSGRFKVDPGEFARVDAEVGNTVVILKKGSLAEGARGVIRKVYDDGRVKASFAEGEFTVDAGEYCVA